MLKINADVNYGNESCMNFWTAIYSITYILNNQHNVPAIQQVQGDTIKSMMVRVVGVILNPGISSGSGSAN